MGQSGNKDRITFIYTYPLTVALRSGRNYTKPLKVRTPYIKFDRAFSETQCATLLQVTRLKPRHRGKLFDIWPLDMFDEHWWASKKIQTLVSRANKHYGYNLTGIADLRIHRHKKPQDWHLDTLWSPCKLTIIGMLTEGVHSLAPPVGSIKLDTGDVLIIPSYYPQKVPAAVKDRSTLVGWVLGPDFR